MHSLHQRKYLLLVARCPHCHIENKKTNYCDPLAHPTWKCHHTNNLWNAKLFIWPKVCCVPSNVGGSQKSQLCVVVGGTENNRLWCVATGTSVKQRHNMHVFRVTTFCMDTCFQSFSPLINRVVHHTVLKFSPCRNKPLPQLVHIADWYSIHALLL